MTLLITYMTSIITSRLNFLHCSELPQHLQYAYICGSQMTYLMTLLIQSIPLVL